LRLAFIVCFLSSRPPKVHLNPWSNYWGPPHNLLLDSSLSFYANGTNLAFYQGCRVADNLFARSSFTYNSIYGYGPTIMHNGYHSTTATSQGSSPVTVAALDFQPGPLGVFYYPATGTNLALLWNAGSTSAHLLGLYHFTTQTNQVKETNSVVDIGLHYVAADGAGVPQDTDGDGLADYREDTNGNGSYGSSTDLANWEDEDTDNDTLGDGLEVAVGTDPEVANPVEGTGGQAGLQVFTPLR
jgi:hypothetical protein